MPRRHSRQKLIEALRVFATTDEGPINMRRFCRHLGTGHTTVTYYFDGGWAELCDEAGIDPEQPSSKKYTHTELLQAYGSIGWHLRKYPTWPELTAFTGISHTTWRDYFQTKRTLELSYLHYETTGQIPNPLPEPTVNPADPQAGMLPSFLMPGMTPPNDTKKPTTNKG
ncbi:hypothetical protein [Calycomorphotria hydatis]|uniref:Uncharacterized protein n=1 Tax=Calycomorphotria hydatis TaxID=2528027 RepID=A0A517TDH5_9PLAN|nr:hypothetical protein [Calycomorphotria hydatis]QDT66425.1 hypothetical protein V22_36920 [Calycomorphotria hydatis]